MHLINNRLGAEDKPQSQVCKKNVLLGHPPNALAARREKVSRLGHTEVVPSGSQLCLQPSTRGVRLLLLLGFCTYNT